ncbi:hypothetical protein LZG74_16925 [Dyadobacter sp. CY327]|uniref:hypothetical protein n=1 Tax=Dyadobacter sp. CY327 TaxID=2907301 RepID=UPI001F2399B4|nr:hypothetical protein [Dyadobacter sp. CY327]MCE7072002.1 hypothetical protein [Dyadobacter sp. CY327]
MTDREKALSAIGNIRREVLIDGDTIETATIKKVTSKHPRGHTAIATKRLIETGAFAVSKD